MKQTLIAIYALFILFLVGSAIFAAKTFDGAVDNAYEKGMQYPAEREKLAKHGWHFSVLPHTLRAGVPGKLELLITGKNAIPIRGAKVSLGLSLLTRPDALPTQAAPERNPGHYTAQINLPQHGYWQIDAKIDYQGEQLQQTFTIYIEKENG